VNSMITPLRKLSVALTAAVLVSLLAGIRANAAPQGQPAGTGHWVRAGGPATGALDLLIDPVDPKVAYAATGENYVLKSLDAGRTWTPMHQGLNDASIHVLAFDPIDSFTVYVGSNTYGQGDGVFKSTDGGATWVRKNRGLPNDADIFSIAVDPTDHLTIYTGTRNPDSLFKSTDGADSWTLSDGGLPYDYVVRSLAVDPADPSTVYAGVERPGYCSGGAYKSTDSGATWMPVGNLELAHFVIGALAIDPGRPQTVYAAAGALGCGPRGGVFKTTDGGESWTQVLKGPDAYALALDPRHPRILFAATETGMVKTTDRGSHWRQDNEGITSLPVQAVEINPRRSQVALAGTVAVIYRTTDRGSTWTALTNAIGDAFVQTLAADPIDGDTIYAAVGEWVFKTADGGRTWALTSDGLSGFDVYDLVPDPTDSHIVYAATDGSGVYRTDDGGETWLPANAGIFGIDFRSLAVDPANPQTLYAGADTGVYKTTDAGQTWTYHGQGLELAGYIEALVVDPSNPDVLYAGGYSGGCCSPGIGPQSRDDPCSDMPSCSTGAMEDDDGVFKSTDGGLTWTRSSLGIGDFLATSVTSLAIDPSSPQTLYAAVSCTYYEECGNTYVYKTTDGAASWSSALYVSSLEWFTSIAIDPVDPAIVYAGHADGGVYRSTDAGVTWETINDGFPVPWEWVTSLILTPNRRLYAGTIEGVFSFVE
jgi:photosystem II stability/assembly factor-like uncharacterized protein